ncbi:MAG: Uncharacterized protein FD147_943 [Chloroflexi bacterium]|nr:MAG: Uncharacterized protein FD147_943 [Chloroflexota bacterium]
MAKNAQKKNGRENKPRVSAQQKKLRRQQVFMAVVGSVIILAMVLALVMNY